MSSTQFFSIAHPALLPVTEGENILSHTTEPSLFDICSHAYQSCSVMSVHGELILLEVGFLFQE
jgi:hypothetical protein